MISVLSRSLFPLVLLLLGSATRAAGVDDLYRAQAFVTGEEKPERTAGFGEGLKEVLVKLSGDPDLAGDPAVAAMSADAALYVRAYSYRDLMAGIPIHDEQGTRQRPFELTIDFDPAKVDAALNSLGRKVWMVARPRVAVFASVAYGASSYALTRDGQRGRDQREALASAARRFGMPIVLPTDPAISPTGLGSASLPADAAQLAASAKALGGDVGLAGALVWNPDALTWTARWTLVSAGRSYRWQVSGVSFDEAFRSAIGGAAQILSGHGSPE
jgi:hypothetical protein